MEGLWDVHNHLLPGVDDGASCEEETFDMLELEYAQGVRNIIFTPHYRKGMFEVADSARISTFERLWAQYKTYYRSKMPGMHFYLGCELFIHPDQKEKIRKRIYRMPGTRTVLIEFSTRDNYAVIDRVITPILNAGFSCIIAHAERYQLEIDDFWALSQRENLYIQVNAGSILGDEGRKQKNLARNMLKEQVVDLVGSDAHNMTSRKVNIGPCAEWVAKKIGSDYAKKIFVDNPAELFVVERKC